MGSYLPETDEGRAGMLATLGFGECEELFSVVPPEVRCGTLDLPEGRSELEVVAHMED